MADDDKLEVILGNHKAPTEETTKAEVRMNDDKEPFNDVIRHGDIIAGYRRNKAITDYPKAVRPWVRIWAILMLVLIIGGIVYDVIPK